MRAQLLRVLERLGGGTRLKDDDVLRWANGTVAAAAASEPPLASFRDPALASGRFLLALLSAVEPRAINPALVTPGDTPEQREQNAK